MSKQLKNIAFIVLSVFTAGLVFLWVRKKKTVSLTDYQPSDNAETEANQLRSSLTALAITQGNFLALGFTDSAISKSSFPVINAQAPITAPTTEKAIRINQGRALIQKYDAQVSSSAKETGIPRFLHYAIILHENPEGIAGLDQGNGVGLGAITLVTPTDSIRTAMKKGRLTTKQIEIIKAHASNATGIFASNDLGAKLISKADLKKPDLNITLIGIQLQNMLYQFGASKLHQALFAYNRGVTSAKSFITTNGLQNADAKTLVEKSKGLPYYNTGSNYVLNQLGKMGMLDIIVNDLGITD